MTTDTPNDPVRVASKTSSFVKNVAEATDPSKSTLGRMGKTAAAVKVGAGLLPITWRLFKRYPVSVSLIGVALVYATFWFRADTSIRRRLS